MQTAKSAPAGPPSTKALCYLERTSCRLSKMCPEGGCRVRATPGGPHSANNPVLPQWGRAGKGCGHPGKSSRHMVLPRGAVRGNDRSERGRPQGAWGLLGTSPSQGGSKTPADLGWPLAGRMACPPGNPLGVKARVICTRKEKHSPLADLMISTE